MIYFVNLYENSYGQAGRFLTYRLYSGESIDEIKKNVIDGLKDSLYLHRGHKNVLNTSGSFADLASSMEDILAEIPDYIDYELSISEPYSDKERALEFYLEYAEIDQDDLQHYEEGNFYFYGHWVIKNQEFFPYAADLYKSHGVIPDNKLIDFLSII